VEQLEVKLTWHQKASKLVSHLSDLSRLLGWKPKREPKLMGRLADCMQFFRGAYLSELRKEVGELASQYKWGDVKDLNWGNLDGRIEMEDHCKHKYLLSIEGAWACKLVFPHLATQNKVDQLTNPTSLAQTLAG